MTSDEAQKQEHERVSLYFVGSQFVTFALRAERKRIRKRTGAVPPLAGAVDARCPPLGLDSPPLRAIGSVTRNWDRASFVNLRRRRGKRPEDDGGESDGGEGRWDGRDAPSDESGSDGSS